MSNETTAVSGSLRFEITNLDDILEWFEDGIEVTRNKVYESIQAFVCEASGDGSKHRAHFCVSQQLKSQS